MTQMTIRMPLRAPEHALLWTMTQGWVTRMTYDPLDPHIPGSTGSKTVRGASGERRDRTCGPQLRMICACALRPGRPRGSMDRLAALDQVSGCLNGLLVLLTQLGGSGCDSDRPFFNSQCLQTTL